MARINPSMLASLNANVIEESDPKAIYSDFQNAANETQKKLVEMNDTVSELNCQIASTGLAVVTQFNPNIYMRLHEVETYGNQMDRLVAASQEMKKQLSDLAAEAENNKPVEYYKAELEQLGLLNPKNE